MQIYPQNLNCIKSLVTLFICWCYEGLAWNMYRTAGSTFIVLFICSVCVADDMISIILFASLAWEDRVSIPHGKSARIYLVNVYTVYTLRKECGIHSQKRMCGCTMYTLWKECDLHSQKRMWFTLLEKNVFYILREECNLHSQKRMWSKLSEKRGGLCKHKLRMPLIIKNE